MSDQIYHFLALGVAYLGLFVISEYLYHKRNWDAENTRKVAHAGAGLLALSFPLLFHDTIYVVALCSAFLVILGVTKRTGFLRSIHAVDRITYGSTMFPLVVCICFWFYSRDLDLIKFYLPTLIMALADPAACLFGRRFPIRPLIKKKSLGGSLAFFVVALFLSVLMFFLLRDNPDWRLVAPQCLAIAFVSMTAEAITQKGFDNLTIPLSTLAVLVLFPI
jgi:phytol kinase